MRWLTYIRETRQSFGVCRVNRLLWRLEDKKITLKWILNKRRVMACSGFNYVRTGTSDWLV
jgi:hypothetical protein